MATSVLHIRSERFVDGSCFKYPGSEIKLKRGRQKTVKWPINEKLCEVRYFLMGDAPSNLGMQGSNLFMHNVPYYPEPLHLNEDQPSEAKRTRFTPVIHSHGNLVQGFGPSLIKSFCKPKVEMETSVICVAPWHCPDMFCTDDSWLWAIGEDSLEIDSQKQREMRVFEAFYPRLTSIPDSPAEPLERPVDNCSIFSVPLIPLEEVETEGVDLETMEDNHTDSAGSDLTARGTVKLGVDVHHGFMPRDPVAESVKVNPSTATNEADSSIAAVAAAACMLVKSLGESDLVDEKLLLAILKNPSLLKSLTCSNIMLNKSKAKNDANGSRVSHEPITSLLFKEALDHGTYSNASPVSVLARWDEGALTESPHGTTSITKEDAHTQQCVTETSNLVSATPSSTSFPLQAPHKTSISGKDVFHLGYEIATRAAPEVCKNSSFKAPRLGETSMPHAYKLKEDVGLSCRNVSHNTSASASCSMLSAAPSSVSVHSTSSSNGEHPWTARSRRDPHRKVTHDPDSKPVHPKTGVPPNMEGAGRGKRFCMYFNSPRGCRSGSSCAFIHQSLDSELNTTVL